MRGLHGKEWIGSLVLLLLLFLITIVVHHCEGDEKNKKQIGAKQPATSAKAVNMSNLKQKQKQKIITIS